jgi:hypothetical protein
LNLEANQQVIEKQIENNLEMERSMQGILKPHIEI